MVTRDFDHEGFEWDAGNIGKSWGKHGVQPLEAEQIFAHVPLLIHTDTKHSQEETRYFALGRTDNGKGLCVVFTMRDRKLRVISARPMSRKERSIYEKTQKNS